MVNVLIVYIFKLTLTVQTHLKPLKLILPYFGKRKQVTKVTFLVKEQNVSVIYTDVNGISECLILHIS